MNEKHSIKQFNEVFVSKRAWNFVLSSIPKFLLSWRLNYWLVLLLHQAKSTSSNALIPELTPISSATSYLSGLLAQIYSQSKQIKTSLIPPSSVTKGSFKNTHTHRLHKMSWLPAALCFQSASMQVTGTLLLHLQIVIINAADLEHLFSGPNAV